MGTMNTQHLNVAAPWSLSHYIPLNGFHPLYRALYDHAPANVTLCAWDNVKLHRLFSSDVGIRESILRKARTEKYDSDRLSKKSIAKAYQEYLWPPNKVLTKELSGDIEFHHTAPFPSLQRPFVFHCEMFAPVWFPFSQQGGGGLERTSELREYYQGILGHPLCLGIFSHVPETLHAFSHFFSDRNIDRKLFSSRIGLSESSIFHSGSPKTLPLQTPRFLFMNSANQDPANFFRRGGHIVLRFWKELLADGRDGLLMLRCAKPNEEDLKGYGVDVSFVKAQTGRSIIWGQDYLANYEMNALMESAHFFLLPSASLHSVSIMQAMKLGAIPVVTDTVGTSVYVTDDEDGIVLRGMRAAIWYRDASTGILIDKYCRTPELDASLVSQLMSRVCVLLDRPDVYWNMRSHMMTYAHDEFSGQAFSDHFWGAASALFQQHQETAVKRTNMPNPETRSLVKCAVGRDEWARIFESPPHPMLKINTGHSVVWSLGGALIHAYGNPPFELRDWSVLAQYYSTGAPQSTYAHTLEELGGKYFGFSKTSGGHSIYALIVWVSGVFKPYPRLYSRAAFIWRQVRRYHSYFTARLMKPNTSDLNTELVREGVSGYNIIRHIDRYYAIPQSEGAFIPAKAESGGYSSCFSGYSLEQVERAVHAANDPELALTGAYQQSAERVSKS